MIRLIGWIVASLLVTVGLAWLVSLPGTVTIELAGYRMQPKIGTAAIILIAAMVVVLVLWSILWQILSAPRRLARRARTRRKDRGAAALSESVIALAEGDAERARLLAREARANLPASAAARLIEARSDLALGDMQSARQNYRALIDDRRTGLAALAGLYEQARTQERVGAALIFARKALALAPATGWARGAVFDDLTRTGKWAQALDMVAAEPARSRAEKAKKKRRLAILHTAIAREGEVGQPSTALENALKALKLQPDFVPAGLIAARIHINRGDRRKAQALLRRLFKATPHPEIAMLYVESVPGASAVDRLKRARELIPVPPAEAALAIVLGRAAADAYEWTLARSALAPFVEHAPTQGVATLMAEIEEGQNGDQGKAREWLARAVKAPRDPVWTADGVISDEWEPISPVTGRLDAFEWKVPVREAASAQERSAPDIAPQSAAPLPAPERPAGEALAEPDRIG